MRRRSHSIVKFVTSVALQNLKWKDKLNWFMKRWNNVKFVTTLVIKTVIEMRRRNHSNLKFLTNVIFKNKIMFFSTWDVCICKRSSYLQWKRRQGRAWTWTLNLRFLTYIVFMNEIMFSFHIVQHDRTDCSSCGRRRQLRSGSSSSSSLSSLSL